MKKEGVPNEWGKDSLKNGIGLHLEENKVYISHTVYPTSEPIQRALQFRAKGTGTMRRQVQAEPWRLGGMPVGRCTPTALNL